MKKLWKKILAAGCATALLMSGPGLTVMAANVQEEQFANPNTAETTVATPVDGDITQQDLFANVGTPYIQDETPDTTDTNPADADTTDTNPADADTTQEDPFANPDATETQDPLANADTAELQASTTDTSETTDATPDDAETTNATPDTAPAEADPALTDSNSPQSPTSADISEDLSTDVESAEDLSTAAEITEDLSTAAEITEDLSTAAEATEETVGNVITLLRDFPIGDGVTVTVQYGSIPTNEGVDISYDLYFYGTNGTLWPDWKENIDEELNDKTRWHDNLTTIEFSPESGKIRFPQDSCGLFIGFPSLSTILFENVDTSYVKDMSLMFSGCSALKALDLSSFSTSNVEDMTGMFASCSNLTSLDLSSFNTSNVTDMAAMFGNCSKLKNLNISSFNTAKTENMMNMFADCHSLTSIDLSNFTTSKVRSMEGMFSACSGLTYLDLKSFDTKNVLHMGNMLSGCSNLLYLDLSSFDMSKTVETDDGIYLMLSGAKKLRSFKTPKKYSGTIWLPRVMYDGKGEVYKKVTNLTKSITLRNPMQLDLQYATVAGISLSYGYKGSAYTPSFRVILNDKQLVEGTDYTYRFTNNVKPGTAKLTIVGRGNYTGVRIKTFEIVDCVSAPVSGKTYLLIPKNNSKTAVCPYSGRMVNNTKVYITDRSSSEAMRFIAKKNADGTWKFINAKCELALAVQQNSPQVGKSVVLYDQTAKKAQNWVLVRKSDNSYAIKNAVSNLSIAMSDNSAVKGTTLSMQITESSGLQRFYIVETDAVRATYDGRYSIRASKNTAYSVEVAGASRKDGANVRLYSYSGTNAQKFTAMYSGAGYYRLVNNNSGLCLTVKGNTRANGANVIQSKWAALSGQRWKILKNSNGTVTMKNALGTVLHLNANKAQNGTNVLAKNASTTGAQKWYLKKA